MYEAEKQGAMHHFSSESGPAEPLHAKRPEPRGLKFRKCGPGAGPVCVRLLANPLNSVFVRKPRGLKFRKSGPTAGRAYPSRYFG